MILDSIISDKRVNMEDIIAVATIIGLPVNTVPTACGNECTIISESINKHLLYIPDKVTKLNHDKLQNNDFTPRIANMRGDIEVIGGHSLTSTSSMFSMCKIKSIDLTNFDTSNVVDMQSMFYACKAEYIKLCALNTTKVKDMNSMFRYCKAKSLDLSRLDTSNVKNMEAMFNDCSAQLNLKNFNTSSVENMKLMFGRCRSSILDLSSFDTRNVRNMSSMFEECEDAKLIDLTSFKVNKYTDISFMFYYCKANIKVKDDTLIKELESLKDVSVVPSD